MMSYNEWGKTHDPWTVNRGPGPNPWATPKNSYLPPTNNPYKPWHTVNMPPRSNMGIGKLGSNVSFSHKLRWTLELKYKDSTLIGPFFAKIASRPKLNIEETEVGFLSDKYWVAGQARWQDLHVNVYIDGRSAADPTSSEYQILNGVGELACAQGMTGRLRLWDGCGTEIENWELKDVYCQNIQTNLEYAGDVTVEMTFKYSEAKYTAAQTWTPGELAASKRQALIDKARAYAPHLKFTEF